MLENLPHSIAQASERKQTRTRGAAEGYVPKPLSKKRYSVVPKCMVLLTHRSKIISRLTQRAALCGCRKDRDVWRNRQARPTRPAPGRSSASRPLRGEGERQASRCRIWIPRLDLDVNCPTACAAAHKQSGCAVLSRRLPSTSKYESY